MRLQKYLAQCGVASRRQAETFIEAGRVQINGQVAALGDGIEPDRDQVLVDGQPVKADASVYLVLNKPQGVVTSVRDTHDRKTVLDCIDGVSARVFPVGRLDLDVEGALLLMNDGELAYRLTHPKFQIDKVYIVRVEGEVKKATIAQFEQGVELEDGLAKPAKAVLLKAGEKSSVLRLVMREGRKREVKRLCAHVGHRVRSLRRVAVANVQVKGMRPGEWRYLTAEEVGKLRRATGLT